MNRFVTAFSVGLSVFYSNLLFAGQAWAPTDHALIIGEFAPPASVLVTDASGKRLGVDPSASISVQGEVDDKIPGNILEEIPVSYVSQHNIHNEEDGPAKGQPAPNTTWEMAIGDGSPQTYRIKLHGIALGKGRVSITLALHYMAPRPQRKSLHGASLEFFIAPGQTREMTVFADAQSEVLNSARVVQAGDLANDVDTVCKLGQINSKNSCTQLEKIAEEIASGKNEGTQNNLREFLNVLKEIKDDRRGSIKNSAYNVLKDEAQSLLKHVKESGGDDERHREEKR